MSAPNEPGPRADGLKRHRGVATRYDKLAVRFQAVLTITIITEWL